jgi:hypothetical protein
MICLYDLVDDLPRLVQDFVFAERVAKTKSLLHAEQILPLNRANCQSQSKKGPDRGVKLVH